VAESGEPAARAGWWRRWRWRIVVGAVAFGVLAGVPDLWENIAVASYLDDEASAPSAPVAIVLGAKVNGDQPTPFLAGRLDLAVRLYTAGKVKVILVSGAQRGPYYDEPAAMRDYLLARHIPARAIVLDRAGFTTWDTCARAKLVFGVTRATVVTNTFHVPRATELCRASGIDAHGVGASSWDQGWGATLWGYFREAPAAAEALWQVVTRPAPQVPGPPETSVADALTGH
jgi:vancomycin permeability regulator SanA